MVAKETKEPFCGACIAVPAAFVGAGIAGVGVKTKSNKKRRKFFLRLGIFTTIVSIIIAIMYYRNCQNCR